MNRLSEKMRLSPTFAISAATGQVTLADIVKPNDTIFYDDENLLKLWIRKDTVAEIKLDSLIDLSKSFSFSGSYAAGVVTMDDFTTQYQMTLGQITQSFTPSLRAQFDALDDGTPHQFPSFPVTNTGTHTFSSFSSFEYVTLSGGGLFIDIFNNLPAPLSGVSITLRNGDDNSIIGSPMNSTAIPAGSSWSTYVDLTDFRVFSTIRADVVFNGSQGTTAPVMVNLSDKVIFALTSTSLEVFAGRFVVPWQRISDSGAEEMLEFDLENEMEITEFRLNTGILDVEINSRLSVYTELSVELPTITRSGLPFAESISVNANSTASQGYSANNLLALLNTNPLQPYNSAPAKYEVWVSSQGAIVNYSSLDRKSVV